MNEISEWDEPLSTGSSELPLAVRILNSDALSFYHMLVFDGREESVQKTRGKMA
jgi:hypothetical protein